MKQITRNQHFVPEFYLKKFASEGKIEVLDIKAERIGKPRSYTSVCYKEFFYAVDTGIQDDVSQAFEDMFGRIENVIAKALPQIIERAINLQLTNSDLDTLAYFMSIQWLRTAFFRERMQQMLGDLMKQMFKKVVSLPGFQDFIRDTDKGHDMSDEQIEKMKHFLQSDNYSIRFNNYQHLKFMGQEQIHGFHNCLLGKKWQIILLKPPYHFITSDNPVAEWMPPRRGIFGPSFMERLHLLALTPTILIVTDKPDRTDIEEPPVDRLSYNTTDENGVLMFNRMLADHAHRFAYAYKRDELEQILDGLGN